MRLQPVPITMGTQWSTSLDSDSFRVTEAWFPPGAVLATHTHDRAVVAVMLRGGFRTDIVRRSLACDAGFAWTEPLGERHANYVGAEGAHALVVQPDGAKAELLRPMQTLLDQVHLLRQANVMGYGHRLLSEIRTPDNLTALGVEALAMLLLADAARVKLAAGNGSRVPGWLLTARDILHDEWRAGVTVAYVADSVGVHPVHLARTFRRHYGHSLGSYVRKLRLDWAIGKLTHSDQQISSVACEAGFSDQSHFTRECKKHLGYTPSEYRSRLGGGSRVPKAGFSEVEGANVRKVGS